MKTENVKPRQEFIFTQTKINKKSAAENRAAKGGKGDGSSEHVPECPLVSHVLIRRAKVGGGADMRWVKES